MTFSERASPFDFVFPIFPWIFGTPFPFVFFTAILTPTVQPIRESLILPETGRGLFFLAATAPFHRAEHLVKRGFSHPRLISGKDTNLRGYYPQKPDGGGCEKPS
jgi:hypothetical protein